MNKYFSIFLLYSSVICCTTSLAVFAATVETKFSVAVMPNDKNQQLLLITVEYAPGESSKIHRHDAHTLVYVLEGSIDMQVKGGEIVTLVAGETFYESPEDIHTVSRNASDLERAKFLVYFLKGAGTPVTTAP
jgi:quercetin dioxygenase-like cupin family protein